jgi:hypothetical protein
MTITPLCCVCASCLLLGEQGGALCAAAPARCGVLGVVECADAVAAAAAEVVVSRASCCVKLLCALCALLCQVQTVLMPVCTAVDCANQPVRAVVLLLLCQVPAVPDAGLAVIEDQLEAVAELQEEVAGCFTAQVRLCS